MALIPSFEICVSNGCGSLSFSDTTGIYNVDSNPTGYGAPNIEIGTVIETHILITLPDGITVIDIENPTGLPTIDEDFIYEILASTLSGSWTSVEDGLYTIEYTVSDGVDTYTSDLTYWLFTCNVDCCVSKMFVKIAQSTRCECDDYKIKNALYAWALLKGVKANANCGDADTISDLITQLNRICSGTSGCGCSN